MAIFVWSIPKPMESIENYNVMLVHGAYGAEKFFFQRVMKTSVVVNGANAVSEFEYCDNSCPLPGPLYC